jgi:hypothetical protein
MFSNQGFPKHKTRCRIELTDIDKDYLISELKKYYGLTDVGESLIKRIHDSSIRYLYVNTHPRRMDFGYDNFGATEKIAESSRYFDITHRLKPASKTKALLQRINNVRIS